MTVDDISVTTRVKPSTRALHVAGLVRRRVPTKKIAEAMKCTNSRIFQLAQAGEQWLRLVEGRER